MSSLNVRASRCGGENRISPRREPLLVAERTASRRGENRISPHIRAAFFVYYLMVRGSVPGGGPPDVYPRLTPDQGGV
jgi:hypothetical protein